MAVVDSTLFASAVERRALNLQAEALVSRAIAMIRRARAVVVRDRVHAAPLLMARREELGRHLQFYQRFKHEQIFDPVVRHGTASSKTVARVLKAECIQMGQVFGDYHMRWQRFDASDWPDYRKDMLETTDLLLNHLDQERRAISKLLTIARFYHPATSVSTVVGRPIEQPNCLPHSLGSVGEGALRSICPVNRTVVPIG